MRIITVSREFGSGGRELGKRLADELGFDYYDREIIDVIAHKNGMDPGYVEKSLEKGAWQTVPLTFKRSFVGPSMATSAKTGLLLEQKKVIESVAAAGRDCVIVGRNADVILEKYSPMNIFVCASMEARIARCISRSEGEEKVSLRDMKNNIRVIDKNRARTREMISGKKWGERENYHLTVNTTGWELRELTPAVADFARRWFERTK